MSLWPNRSTKQLMSTIALILSVIGCDATTPKAQKIEQTNTQQQVKPSEQAAAPTVVISKGSVHKHNPDFFTQGLLFDNNTIFETTGLHGRSRLISYAIDGEEQEHLSLENNYFGEGLTSLGNKLYWLTWKKQTLFVIDKTTLKVTDRLTYKGQGWGLTSDGKYLIKSNGSNQLSFHTPEGFKAVKTLDVMDAGVAVEKLNELEWINGFIYANVWFSDDIVKIDPQDGRVITRIDLSTLRQQFKIPHKDVLNGIAHNKNTGMTLLTGKNWPVAVLVKLP